MKQIIITGASRGFGKEITLKIAEEGEEVHLHLISRSSSEETQIEAEKHGARVTTYAQDLTEFNRLQPLMDDIFDHFESSEKSEYLGLINNAGTLHPIGPLGKYDVDDYRQNLEINYVSPTLITHLFIQKTQNMPVEKRVIFISSGAAKKAYHGWSHYCSTKAGINMLMETAALEQESMEYPVKLAAFNPGRIETDMQKLIRQQSPEDFPKVDDFIASKTDGRMGSPKQMAGVVAGLMMNDDYPSGEFVKGKAVNNEQ